MTPAAIPQTGRRAADRAVRVDRRRDV